jgi:glycine dehydrogenase subunit 2
VTINQSGWKPAAPVAGPGDTGTTTGNRALMLEEPLIFEIGDTDTTGVDFADTEAGKSRLGALARTSEIGLPGLTEPETVRHYTRLSRQNYAIDLGLFPLGSCTMKHNPRLNEKVVLVPESAHGTNPATAAFCGYRVENIPATDGGRVDLEALKARLGPDVAAVMITNPNTCGLFEPDMKAISDAVHAAGAFVYCDGANFNAIVGKVRPGDLGIDAMHINLHKTFSTPHGGGGPGSGPVVLSEALGPFMPLPYTARTADGVVHLIEEEQAGEFLRTHFGGAMQSFGRMTAFHGQMGMFTRALAYILSHGADGLRQVAEDAVLNANYVLRSLEDVLDAPFAHSGPCMHEAIFSDAGFAGGITTLDLAKALIDEGFHPMTMYFPLVVHGAMLVEPTETESKAALDQFIAALRAIAERARAGDESLKSAPVHAPRRRLDETLAARKPVIGWKTPAPDAPKMSGRNEVGGQ